MTHVIVSHGSDFFGVDTFPAGHLRDLGQYVRSVLPAADHQPLTQLLDDADTTERTLDSGQAALLAVLLRRVAAHRRLNKQICETAVRLGIAAANAAADPEPWTWTWTTEVAR